MDNISNHKEGHKKEFQDRYMAYKQKLPTKEKETDFEHRLVDLEMKKDRRFEILKSNQEKIILALKKNHSDIQKYKNEVPEGIHSKKVGEILHRVDEQMEQVFSKVNELVDLFNTAQIQNHKNFITLHEKVKRQEELLEHLLGATPSAHIHK